jgi:hypothetical protein
MRRRTAARPYVERSAFAGFRFPPEVITVAVRWYLRYGLSYRDVEELLAERGVEVDHVTVGPSAPAVPAVPAPPPETPKRGPLVRVHISTDQNVLLDRRPEGSETWVPACAAPCDEELPLNDTYRLSGSAMRSSTEFRLHGSPGGRVDLAVDPSTKRAWWVGAGIGGMGLVIDGYGLYIALLGALMSNSSCYPSDYSTRSCDSSRSAGQTMRNVGLVMLIPGTAAAIVGGAMMVGNWRTGITQSEGTERAAKARPLDAFTRTAEVRPPEPLIGGAPTIWVPLASGKF